MHWALTLTHTWFIEQRHLLPAQYVANPSLLAKLRTRNCKDLNHCNRNNMQTYKNKWCRWGDRWVMTPNRAHSETPNQKLGRSQKPCISIQYREGKEKLATLSRLFCRTQQKYLPVHSPNKIWAWKCLTTLAVNTWGVLYLEYLLGPSSFHNRIANPTELKTKLHVCITNFLTLAAKQERQWERKAERKKAGGERDHCSLVVSLYELQNKIAKWGGKKASCWKAGSGRGGGGRGGEKLVWEAAGEEPGGTRWKKTDKLAIISLGLLRLWIIHVAIQETIN